MQRDDSLNGIFVWQLLHDCDAFTSGECVVCDAFTSGECVV